MQASRWGAWGRKRMLEDSHSLPVASTADAVVINPGIVSVPLNARLHSPGSGDSFYGTLACLFG